MAQFERKSSESIAVKIPQLAASRRYLILFCCLLFAYGLWANDGYELWLKYRLTSNTSRLNEYVQAADNIFFPASHPTLQVAQNELKSAFEGITGKTPNFRNNPASTLVIATQSSLPTQFRNAFGNSWQSINDEGYLIKAIRQNGRQHLIVSAKKETGLLYGIFHLIRLMQMDQSLNNVNIVESPAVKLRVLNHWDNLDRTVERGYAGFSIWNWHKLPEYIDQRYIDYARANASVGINGTVLTNVNANALVLTKPYLEKVKALADVFRPYGIKVYLTARFSAPIEIGGLKTADPLNDEVREWWKQKVQEIYEHVPDFGGFVVKANSEGQPGPQNYDRNHVDGANMLASALEPHNGVVMWRAFVYSEHDPTDRAKQAYNEFVPYDGQFASNVLIQVKNGAIDFQPREPFHPMFGSMPKTPLMMEFQITQEYLGFSTHLVFLPKLFEEVLQEDTYKQGKGTTVARVIDGSLHNNQLTGMAGVANIGTDRNWTGHPFGQANWYGYGRLAWNPQMSAQDIAKEWLSCTYSTDGEFVDLMAGLMVKSRETVVKYMTPLGLHHIMDAGHHYGPGPWIGNMPRPDWTSVYYHKADSAGIGFDRTELNGSGATAQYSEFLRKCFNDPAATPEKYLLWFHHLSWTYRMKSGNSLWDEIGLTYQEGVDEVNEMIRTWESMQDHVDSQQHKEVSMLLSIQLKEAKWWKDACMTYFQQFSKMPFPKGMEKPEHDLAYYQSLKFPYAPGIRPRW